MTVPEEHQPTSTTPEHQRLLAAVRALPEWMPASKAAPVLGCTARTLERDMAEGLIRHIWPTRKGRLVPRSEIERLIAER